MNVVVVESPAKAKTINKYLGKDYKVLASFGHIRDLPAKDGSVRPDDGFSMDWEMDARSKKQFKEITDAMKGADKLYLATDPDREGEAISWHVQEVLQQKKLLKDVEVQRVVFHEITKQAVLDAVASPRQVNQELVEAYLARRALDYLVGFNLSPVLWRKLPGSRSAGRVQSVALRLICERETEIEAFNPVEYWSIDALFTTPKRQALPSVLTHLDGEKLDKHAIGYEAAAKQAVAQIEAGTPFTVGDVIRKKTRRNPAAPFTTSTLQQEAARKLGFGAKRTMQVAQKLYEGINLGGETVGLITYMRTDAVNLSNEAIFSTRDLIAQQYGADFVPKDPRVYKTKAKNAQEAHEAIRPTDVKRRPEEMARFLDADQLKLYSLIWKRTVACQMASAVLDQVAVDIKSPDRKVGLRATGSVIVFQGFLTLYKEGLDDQEDEDGEGKILPDVQVGDTLQLGPVDAHQHFTQPPPRYSEASLVKRMEELGIGRPSTYASIISVLQDRDYVRLEKRRFIPEDRGRLVTAFLSNFFSRYVQYDFTAELEDQLDDVSNGSKNWQHVLEEFWRAFSGSIDETKELRVRDVLDALNAELEDHFFPERENGTDKRSCPTCDNGELSLKLGKFGAFIGCSNYPDCKYTRPLVQNDQGEQGVPDLDSGPKELGTDPETGDLVTLRRGPYGLYVQLGEEDPEDKKKKPKRASLTSDMNAAELNLQAALKLLSLPRNVGIFPETGEIIKAGIGRFGPYVSVGKTFVSIKDDSPYTIGENRAIDLIHEKMEKTQMVVLGQHPEEKKDIIMQNGRWGPFVKVGKINVRLPKDMDREDMTLELAIEMLNKKGAGAKKTTKKKAAPKKTAEKKAPAKKAPAKKAAPKRKAPAKKASAKTEET